jgi:hypothetical protein
LAACAAWSFRDPASRARSHRRSRPRWSRRGQSSGGPRDRVRKVLSTPTFTVLESAGRRGSSARRIGEERAGDRRRASWTVLGYGSNIKSVLLARGISEIVRLGRKMKAKPETFLGLSGLGDLATTAFSIHSRNHGCGFELGKGASLKEVLSRSEMVVEGVETADSALALGQEAQGRGSRSSKPSWMCSTNAAGRTPSSKR